MKRIILMLLAVVALSAAAQVPAFSEGQLCIYEEVYTVSPGHDGKLHINDGERAFFMFYKQNGKLCGRVNATTDELSGAREGYTPGYIVCPMNDLTAVNDSTLQFTISPKRQFDIAPPLSARDEGMAVDMGIPMWRQDGWRPDTPTRTYTIVFHGDKLTVMQDTLYQKGWIRIFLPVKP